MILKTSSYIFKVLDSLPVLCLFCSEQMNRGSVANHQASECIKMKEASATKQNKWDKLYSLTNLTLLHLENCPKVADNFLSDAPFHLLQTLTLKKCPSLVSPSLSNLKSLRSLYCHSQSVRKLFVASICNCLSLEELAFSKCHFEDTSHFSNLSNLTSLHTLAFPKCTGIGEDFLLPLIPSLTLLNMQKTKVSDKLCASLVPFDKLVRLNFEHTDISIEGLKMLLEGREERLEELSLANCTNISAAQKLADLVPSLTSLQRLSLPPIEKCLTKFVSTSLTRLDLSSPYKRDFVNAVQNLRYVSRISLKGPVTDAVLFHLSKYCHGITWMSVTSTLVTNEGMKSISLLSELRKLSLSCMKVTDEGMRNLFQNSLSLVSLNVDGCSISRNIFPILSEANGVTVRNLVLPTEWALEPNLSPLENIKLSNLTSVELTLPEDHAMDLLNLFATLPKLRKIIIRFGRLSSFEAGLLGKCASLESLTMPLSESTFFDSFQLGPAKHSLHTLSLFPAEMVTDKTVKSLTGLPNLINLLIDIENTALSGVGKVLLYSSFPKLNRNSLPLKPSRAKTRRRASAARDIAAEKAGSESEEEDKEEKYALVTGVGYDIMYAIAERLVFEGYTVICTFDEKEKDTQPQELSNKYKDKVLLLAVDTSLENTVKLAYSSVISKGIKKIDVVVIDREPISVLGKPLNRNARQFKNNLIPIKSQKRTWSRSPKRP